MLLDHQTNLKFGGIVRRGALAETNDLLQAVDQYLERMTRGTP